VDPKSLYFATSGIRGKANTFINPELALRVGRAVCAWVNREYPTDELKEIYVGYDNRRNSQSIAYCLAATICSSGIDVKLFNQSVPTPLVIHATTKNEAHAGIIVTGSHLPADDNGLILFDRLGNYYKGYLPDSQVKPVEWEKLGKIKEIHSEIDDYKQFLINIKEKLAIQKMKIRVLIDPVHGPMRDYISSIVALLVDEIIQVNWEDDDRYPGRISEPTPENIEKTRQKVVENKCDLGIATDMDGDRVIFITKSGKVISGDFLGAMLAELIWERHPDTTIVVPINTSSIIDFAAKGRKFSYCKVGPPNIIEAIRENNSKYGFEETGKYIFSEVAIWPDAIITTLMLFSLLQEKQTTLDEIYMNMPRLTGVKTKIPLSRDKSESVMLKVIEIADSYVKDVKSIQNIDGLRINFNDLSWLLLRPSGTEDYFRIFAEHKDPIKATALNTLGEKLIRDAFALV
jgi:phosphoglucosamine mutase